MTETNTLIEELQTRADASVARMEYPRIILFAHQLLQEYGDEALFITMEACEAAAERDDNYNCVLWDCVYRAVEDALQAESEATRH